MKHLPVYVITLLLLVFASCKKNDTPSIGNITITKEAITLNPNGDAPLTASISVTTSLPAKISISVKGRHDAESDVNKDFDSVSVFHNIHSI